MLPSYGEAPASAPAPAAAPLNDEHEHTDGEADDYGAEDQMEGGCRAGGVRSVLAAGLGGRDHADQMEGVRGRDLGSALYWRQG